MLSEFSGYVMVYIIFLLIIELYYNLISLLSALSYNWEEVLEKAKKKNIIVYLGMFYFQRHNVSEKELQRKIQ